MLTDALQYRNLHGVILRALSIMTSHGGAKERISVADKAGDDIVQVATNVPSDDPIFTYCVTVLCHACKCSHARLLIRSHYVLALAYGRFNLDNTPNQRQRAQAWDAKPFLALMARASKLEDGHVAGHAFSSLTMLTVDKQQDILDSPEALRCLVGHLRHPELATRIEAFRAILT